MKRINEIVVVEGKTDSQLLKELYDVDTIELVEEHVNKLKRKGYCV